MKKYWITGSVIVLLAAVAAAAFFFGNRHEHHRSHEHARTMSLQGRSVIDMGRAIDMATGRVPGDVLKVELENEDGRFIYEVKVLATDGRVREIKLDAQDGSLIEIEDD